MRDTPAAMARYKVEPYVVAADVYAVAPHTGRGGWTWYTGSAGWMYRLFVESLLGLTREADQLRFRPCMPADWSGFTMRYVHGESTYEIAVVQVDDGAAEQGPARVTLDGVLQAAATITLVDDRATHQVVVVVRAAARITSARAAADGVRASPHRRCPSDR